MQNGECNVRFFFHFSSTIDLPKFKSKVTCENTDFEFWYNEAHTKEKPSEIANLTIYIRHFAFLSEKVLKLNGRPEYFGIY